MLQTLHNITTSLLLLFVLAGTATAGEDQRQIAVAAEAAEITARISNVAARAPYFLIFDHQNNLLQTVKNPSADASGAGPKAAALLHEKKITLVIAGQFGPKMLKALKSYEIQAVERQGRIIDAVKEQNHAR